MSQVAAVAADFLALLADEGETITLTKVAAAAPGVDGNQAETLTNTDRLAWCAQFSRREVDGVRVIASDLRCWVSMAAGEEEPAPGWRVTRSGRKFQVLGVSPGPSHVGAGVLELHLRQEGR